MVSTTGASPLPPAFVARNIYWQQPLDDRGKKAGDRYPANAPSVILAFESLLRRRRVPRKRRSRVRAGLSGCTG